MNIHELISIKDEINEKQKQIYRYYESGLQYYFDQNWSRALDCFNTVIKHRPDDAPSRLMLDRCLKYRDNPPPEGWNGVFAQTEK
jgi:lipopolysaccharide biosynthesis regulator YciM